MGIWNLGNLKWSMLRYFVNIFNNKKSTNSSRSNSRPKPSLSAPPICGLNCRCCRLEVANGEKVRRQTKWNTKKSTRKTHEITQMLQVFWIHTTKLEGTENGGPCGCHQAYNPRSLGQNSDVVYSHMCCSHVAIEGKIWRDGPEG